MRIKETIYNHVIYISLTKQSKKINKYRSIPFGITAVSTVVIQIGEWEYNKIIIIIFNIVFIFYLRHNVSMCMCTVKQYLQKTINAAPINVKSYKKYFFIKMQCTVFFT